MYTCPECGQLADMNNNVCENCGIRVKICPECGTAVEETAETCNFCGLSLNKAVPVSTNTVKSTPTQEIKAEATNEEQFEKLKEQEKKLARYAEDSMKPFATISKILKVVGSVGLFCSVILPIFLLIIFDISSDVFLFFTSIGLVLFSLLEIIGDILGDLSPLFTISKITNKVKRENFDYISYYKQLKVYKSSGGALVEAKRGDRCQLYYSMPTNSIQLVQAMAYKDKPAAIVPKIIEAGLSFFFHSAAVICLIFGFNANIPSIANGGNINYLHPCFIAAVVIWIISGIINIIIASCSKSDVNWIFDIKESN